MIRTKTVPLPNSDTSRRWTADSYNQLYTLVEHAIARIGGPKENPTALTAHMRRHSRRSACDRCRDNKLRCERDSRSQGNCERCQKSNVVCTTTPNVSPRFRSLQQHLMSANDRRASSSRQSPPNSSSQHLNPSSDRYHSLSGELHTFPTLSPGDILPRGQAVTGLSPMPGTYSSGLCDNNPMDLLSGESGKS